jgi:hypothetical protein
MKVLVRKDYSGRLYVTFSENLEKFFNLKEGVFLNISDAFIEDEKILSEEEDYFFEKNKLAALEGIFAPGRIKQGEGIIFIQ